MAQYNDRTGKTSWQRFLPVTQRESIEKWLHQHYPKWWSQYGTRHAENSGDTARTGKISAPGAKRMASARCQLLQRAWRAT
jgi:hypothetical protein